MSGPSLRIDKVTTRTGDDGTTGLVGGARVGKDSPRIEAVGAVDELNAALGVARAALASGDHRRLAAFLAGVQGDLFNLGAVLATPDPARHASLRGVDAARVAALEQELADARAGLPALTSFVLPAGGEVAARLHLARAVCRRAERRTLALGRLEPIGDHVLVYLNRLSDALFLLARVAARAGGQAEEVWVP